MSEVYRLFEPRADMCGLHLSADVPPLYRRCTLPPGHASRCRGPLIVVRRSRKPRMWPWLWRCERCWSYSFAPDQPAALASALMHRCYRAVGERDTPAPAVYREEQP